MTSTEFIIYENGNWAHPQAAATAAAALIAASDYCSSPVHPCPVADELVDIPLTDAGPISIDHAHRAEREMTHTGRCSACGEDIRSVATLVADCDCGMLDTDCPR